MDFDCSGDDDKSMDKDARFLRDVLCVLQFLKDHQLEETAETLSAETGVTFSECMLENLTEGPVASRLSAALCKLDEFHSPKGEVDVRTEWRLRMQRLDETGDAVGPPEGGDGTSWEFRNLHSGNITAVRFVPSQTLHPSLRPSEECEVFATASVDRDVKLVACRLPKGGGAGEVVSVSVLEHLPAPALCLDAGLLELGDAQNSNAGLGPLVVLGAGSMGGDVCVCELSLSGIKAHTARRHSKFVTAVRFTPDCHRLASLSKDGTVCLHRLDVRGDKERDLCVEISAERNLDIGGDPSALEWIRAGGERQSVEGDGGLGLLLVVAVRGEHFLRVLGIGGGEQNGVGEGKGRGGFTWTGKIGLNAFGDSVVSFEVLDLCRSGDSGCLLLCTDKGRCILLDTRQEALEGILGEGGGGGGGGEEKGKVVVGTQLANLYGACSDDFGRPCCVLSPEGRFAFASSPLGQK
eukprot:Cvel_7514.t1-p1 / transcript=Cvel_7514.t1 / gene=Cvel_7514 / organism=Chromera_velia_CCMP2878 / gene_product=hypothetical protein / transcript_product=hypothetical protein / location=Cvel_scaffold395:296-3427(-) / protein_length=464 / sequence_SO=supercontig / SO=protein_coding / is_pseudo=false